MKTIFQAISHGFVVVILFISAGCYVKDTHPKKLAYVSTNYVQMNNIPSANEVFILERSESIPFNCWVFRYFENGICELSYHGINGIIKKKSISDEKILRAVVKIKDSIDIIAKKIYIGHLVPSGTIYWLRVYKTDNVTVSVGIGTDDGKASSEEKEIYELIKRISSEVNK